MMKLRGRVTSILDTLEYQATHIGRRATSHLDTTRLYQKPGRQTLYGSVSAVVRTPLTCEMYLYG